MKKIWLTASGALLAGASVLATMPAQAFWGSWGSGGPWYGGPWHGGNWWGGYPYYGGWGGYPHYGGWGGYGYPFYGAYPFTVAPAAVAPAASSAAK